MKKKQLVLIKQKTEFIPSSEIVPEIRVFK